MIGAMPGTRSSPILVGRENELATLDRALERAVDGQAGIVLVAGDAGLGKSRLVAEFADPARAAGSRVVVGGCIDLGGDGLPYGPFLEALRDLATELEPSALSDLLGDIVPELVGLVPEFATFLVSDAARESAAAAAVASPATAAPIPAS